MMNIKDAIAKASGFRDLTEKETQDVFDRIMSGEATPAQIAALITALRMKGETVDELTGAAKAMRRKAVRIKVTARPAVVVDTCGTGGSGTNTFNVSTAAAFVVAGCGVKVAKHGNRSASSHCGSADVLEELGVGINLPARFTEECINRIGIGFMFAPLFHGAMKHAAIPRKEIGVRTIFNMIGPLCNPASAKYQVMGVYEERLTEVMARVLKKLGARRAYVVHGAGPLDEVSISGRTRVSELKAGKIRSYYVTPASFGVKKASLKSIKGGSARHNARMIVGVLTGQKGSARDIVLANSALALMAAGKAGNLRKAVRAAAGAIDSGRAMEKLEQLIIMTNR